MKLKFWTLVILVMSAYPGALRAQCFLGWGRLVEIVVSNPNATALSNQPVLVTLNTQSLIGAGKMRADVGDVRFADTDCCTPLDYYVESGTINTTTTRFWVEVPAVPANGSRKIVLYYGNASSTSLSNPNTTFSVIGNDSVGTAPYSADRTFNAKGFAFPYDVTTNVWRVYSNNAGTLALKTTTGANQITATTASLPIVTGFNKFDRELVALSGGHPGFYIGAGGNLQIGNGTPFAPPCGGAAAAFLGNTDLGVGNTLVTQSCGVFPNLKIWYRRKYAAEPTTSLGPELSFSATISVAAPTTDSVYCSNSLRLSATSGFTTYQWYKDGSPIPGANAATYLAPPQPGGFHNYHCEAVLGSCINKVSNVLHLTINPVPVLTSILPDNACAPSTTLSETHTLSFGSLPTYDWSFGDASSSSLVSPYHTYPSHGTYLTTLIVTSDHNCKDTLAENVIIYPKPQAGFIVPVTNCDFNTVPFTNTSMVNSAFGSTITGWQWSFGDAATSTVQSPGSHLYPGPNGYTPRLIVTTNFGCKDTTSTSIFVYPKPVINSISAPAVCEVNASQFSANISLGSSPSSSLSTWDWTFGDAQSGTGATPSHLYTNPGTYTVQLISTTNKGCMDTLVTTHQYHPKPNIVSITAPAVCEPLPTTISNSCNISSTNGSVISSYLWDFGDGQNASGSTVSHAYAVSDTYTVRLITISNKGCRDTLFKQMDVYPKPVIASISDPAICWNLPVQFSQASTVAGTFGGQITQYSWAYGDGQNGLGVATQHNYATAGRYTTTLFTTTNHNCKDTLTSPVVVYPKPVIQNIAVTDVCDPDSHSFAQSSIVDTLFASTIGQWDWTFGDGTMGSGNAIVHDYQNPGAYQSVLYVETNHACRDTLTDSVYLFPKPEAAFVNPDRCEPEIYSPLDISSVNSAVGAAINGWHWDFGDSYTSTQQFPSHNYASPGSYPVELQIVTNHGCRDTLLQVMRYNPKPQAAFSWVTNCWPQALALTDGSTISNAFLQSWDWSFGDGANDTLQNPQHPYAVADSYAVQLIVGSNDGCSDTLVQQVVSNPKPVASFDVAQRCMPLALPFHNLSTLSAGALAQTRWDFGDGSVDTAFSAQHAYALADSYWVRLVVYSDSSCSDTVDRHLVVNPAPDAEFSVSLTCLPDSANFLNASTGAPIGWEWTFGDGGIDTMPSPVHLYSASGTYPVQLVVVTDSACTDTLMQMLDVHPHAQLTLGPDIYYCAYDTLVLEPTPVQPTVLWSDGTTLDSLRIWASGDYWVEIADSNGCQARDTIVVTDAPTISLTVTPGPHVDLCEGATVALDASHPEGFSWLWGDGSTDNHLVVDTAGVFTAIVFNAYTCRDTDSVTVVWVPAPQPELGADTAFCEGDSVHLDPGPDGTQWLWSTGDTTQTIDALLGGLYQVTATNAAGCQGTDYVTLVRYALPRLNLGSDTALCKGETMVFDAGLGYANYLWSTGDTTSSIELDSSATVFVQLTNIHGCTNQSTVALLTVHPIPATPAVIKDGPILSSSTAATAYQWLLDGEPIWAATAAQWEPQQNGLYAVEVFDTNGCVAVSLPLEVIATVGTKNVPQAITPNGDGANDRLVIHGIEFYPQSELVIFSRWGEEVYRTVGYLNEWDGHYKGNALPAGTYYYVLKLDSQSDNVKGYVQIEY